MLKTSFMHVLTFLIYNYHIYNFNVQSPPPPICIIAQIVIQVLKLVFFSS
jgi:hypothetical protein